MAVLHLALQAHRIDIPFRLAFKHSSADRSATQSVWVEARVADLVGVGEGCPREYVTGENLASAAEFFTQHRRDLCEQATGMDNLATWMLKHAAELDANPAAWCAVELAVLDALARRDGVPVEKLLSLPPPDGQFQYTAVVGDSGPETFRVMAGLYHEMGFSDFKLKLSGDLERDRDKLIALGELQIDGLRVRVDANNLWDQAGRAADHIAALDYAFLGIEEPLPANQFEAMRSVSRKTGCRIILDESLLRADQVESIDRDPEQWIINIRVSKMGGLLRSLEVVRRAREAGIAIIVGAQVGETSVLTRAGLVIASAAGKALVAQEGAFGTLLLESDVADPPLMFGKAGILDVDAYKFPAQSGWGLTLREDREFLLPLLDH